ncbi:MAG: hypothetical protein K5838_01555 [Elusimicrobiales bacterium]|nr:hypothetical protein [Elusimicrobiales bacterium]
MKIAEKIYSCLPVFMQHAACTIKGFLINRRRYNSEFFSFLNAYENRSVNAEQELRKFMCGISEMDYYRRLFSECCIDTSFKNVYSEIAKLPVLTKEEVKRNTAAFINHSFKGKVITAHTSGTTGGGLVFPEAEEAEHKQWAIWWRYRRSHGIDFRTWCGWFGGKQIIFGKARPPFYRINLAARQIMFSAYHLCEETAEHYYSVILKRNLEWLHGYPSQLSILSSFCLRRGFKPADCVKIITFGSENLEDWQKNRIHEMFPNASLRQHYGLTEMAANISEDEKGRLIPDDDFAYMEFLPVEKGSNLCRIIGTNFSNPAFPLVRYDTGDIAEIERIDGKTVIKRLDGRKEDFLRLPDGRIIGRLGQIFLKLPEIAEAQLVQKTERNIEVRIVKMPSFTAETEKMLYSMLNSRFDGELDIKIKYCDKIARTSSGKLRMVLSEINAFNGSRK